MTDRAAAIARAVLNAAPAFDAPPDEARSPGPIARIAAVVLNADPARLESTLVDEGEATTPEAAASRSVDDWADFCRENRFRAGKATLPALVRVLAWYRDRVGSDTANLDAAPTEALRGELVAIRGIGATTAGRLLSEAFGRASFAVDRGSYRIAYRHGWIDESSDLDSVRAVFEDLAPDDPAQLGDLARGFERIAQRHCKAARPICGGCPLESFLPSSGPVAGC